MKISRREMMIASGLLPLLDLGKPSKTAAQTGADKRNFMDEKKDVYDCVIIGGGCAGSSAALTLGRARRRVLVCDRGNPRNAPAAEAHTFLTRDGTNPLELLKIGREQLKPYRTVKFQFNGVKEIKKSGKLFEVVFDDGTTENARKILLAFGVKDEFPPIENFGDFWGKTVFHCPFCHGYEVRDEPLAIVGRGAEAVGMAALLKSWSRDLVLCTNGDGSLSEEQKTLLAKHGVPVREEKIVKFEGKKGTLETIVFETGKKLARRGMLIRLPQKLRTDLAEKLGCELTERGYVKTDDFHQTSVEGVYAAGDIISPMQSIAAAVAQGSRAAAGANHALGQEDFT